MWLSLLRACAGFEPFMKRKAGRVTPGEVATFLMREPRFPRSLVFCLREADQRLASIRSPGDEARRGIEAPPGSRLGSASLAGPD